jgi:hypothetical protein
VPRAHLQCVCYDPRTRMRQVLIAVLIALICACGPKEPVAADRETAAGTATVSETAPPAVIPAARSACELVSNSDLEKITGMKFAPGVTVTREGQLDRCGFEQATGGTGGITVALYVENVDEPSTAFQITSDMQRASGAGDSAHWSPSQRAFVARKGNRVIIVAFKSEGGDQQRWAADIARRALARL